MMTIVEMAEKLNVSRDLAYGFVRFCEATKVLRPVGKQLTGERGKPAFQYEITDDDLGMLASLLATLIAVPADETPATEVQVALAEVQALNASESNQTSGAV